MTEKILNPDNTAIFEYLWGIILELRHKLEGRFQLHLQHQYQDLQQYTSIDGKTRGSLQVFSGEEIDWLVNGWLGNPTNFTTMRLTIWLGSHINVPHLAFEFGTVPNIFFYIDYIGRTDMLTNLEYLERYYEPLNQKFLDLQSDSRFTRFTSKSLYIRNFQSPINFCYTCSTNDDNLNSIRLLANEILEGWLTWVDEAEAVPEDNRLSLAQRDLFLRRTSAERDPGNILAAQMFGEELTDKLVRALWRGEEK